MGERDWAEEFDRNVDGLLNSAGRMDDEPAPAEYDRAVQVARVLAAADFSIECGTRDVLRRRVLSRSGKRTGVWPGRPACTISGLSGRRQLVLAVVTVVLVTLITTGLIWPDEVIATAQDLQRIIQQIKLGPHTSVGQFRDQDPPRRLRLPRLPGNRWHVSTEIGAFGGRFSEKRGTVHIVSDSESAQSLVTFTLQEPAYLPEGYVLREAKVVPRAAFLFYEGAGQEIILVQWAVGPEFDTDPSLPGNISVGIVTNGTVQEITFDGRPAVWMNDRSLVWEVDGMSYTLGGPDLTLEQALRIAASIG